MAGLSTANRNAAVDAAIAGTTHVAVMDASATEVAGGTYARQAVTNNAASSGVADLEGAEAWNIPSGTRVAFLAGYGALSAGTQQWLWPLQGNLSDAAKLPIEVVAEADDNLFYRRAHGLSSGNEVIFTPREGGSMPGNITTNTVYFVIAAGLTVDVFSVSTTLGGSAVDISSDAACFAVRVMTETFNSDGILNVPDSGIDYSGLLV